MIDCPKELRRKCIEFIRQEAGRFVSSGELADRLDECPIRIAHLLYAFRPDDIETRKGAGGGFRVKATAPRDDPFHHLGNQRIAQIARFLLANPGFHPAWEIAIAIDASKEVVHKIVRRYREYVLPNYYIRSVYCKGYMLVHSPVITKSPRQPPSQHEKKPMEKYNAETIS